MSTIHTRVDLDAPRHDQSTYWGRVRHFVSVTNPLNVFASSQQLDSARRIVYSHRAGEELSLTDDELWRAKALCDSAFHPDTGHKMFILGRMSAQVPCNMTITGCMMTFYKSVPAVVFWQWINQSFNALVNYTNRSGSSSLTTSHLCASYVMATGGALVTALGLNSLVKSAPALVGRLVPFAAVAAANCVNIPMMRSQELSEGIVVTDDAGVFVSHSRLAAREAIGLVIISRICMAAPGMVGIPVIMNWLEKRGVLARFPHINAPLQVAFCGLFLSFATPMCCALFPQRSSVAISRLEPHIQDACSELLGNPSLVFYNKGL